MFISLISGPGEEEGNGGVIAASVVVSILIGMTASTTLPRRLIMPLVKRDRLGVGACVGLHSISR